MYEYVHVHVNVYVYGCVYICVEQTSFICLCHTRGVFLGDDFWSLTHISRMSAGRDGSLRTARGAHGADFMTHAHA